jgi:ubiquinone/menaquinone biosynthesis C-methylase UbiE
VKIYSELVFPKLFDRVLSHQGFELNRLANLKKVRGRILEIGIGTGLNLDYYPQHVKRITAIEPNRGMRKVLRNKIAGHRIRVECHAGVAEALPFANESFDTVVSTLTFCSLTNIEAALGEIRRVLAPGGLLVFMEHGLSPAPKVAAVQRLLNPVQAIVGCGCKLTVNVKQELEKSRFKIHDLHMHYVGCGPKFLGHIYEGTATPLH